MSLTSLAAKREILKALRTQRIKHDFECDTGVIKIGSLVLSFNDFDTTGYVIAHGASTWTSLRVKLQLNYYAFDSFFKKLLRLYEPLTVKPFFFDPIKKLPTQKVKLTAKAMKAAANASSIQQNVA